MGWSSRLRSFGVLVPLALGLATVAGGCWWYWDAHGFARRAVVTEAVVERVEPPYRLDREDGPPTYVSYGTVRYEAAGRKVVARVKLSACRRVPCGGAAAPGDRLTVAYDPDSVRRAARTPPGGPSSAPHPGMLLLVGVGLLFIAAAAYTLFSPP
ncbi:DUF3592 domain-containing protein [Spirillospora sp. NPDC052242]